MRILIVKASSLGDIVHLFDTVSYLREVCPFAKMDWMVEEEGAVLVRAHPDIDAVYEVRTRQWRLQPWRSRSQWKALFATLPKYQLVFDFQGNCKSAWILHHVRAQMKVGFGWKAVAEWPNLLFTDRRYTPPAGKNIREDYLYLAQSFFRDWRPYQPPPLRLLLSAEEQSVLQTIPQGVTIVCPFSAWPNKQLPRRLLLDVLARERGPFYFTWTGRAQLEQVQSLAAAVEDAYVLPQLTLPMLQCVMAQSSKVIAMDSLPLHLCGTTATASLSFFGPSSSQKYAPRGEHHQAIQGECPYGVRFEKRCPQLRSCQSGACINKLKSR